MEHLNHCRVCKGRGVITIHDFGEIPIADQLTFDKKEKLKEEKLTLGYCEDCHHLQVNETIDPNTMFKKNYPYFSSQIPEVVDHFDETYHSVISKKKVQKNDIILEIAANDGVLLKKFSKNSDFLYAVEPSEDHIKYLSEQTKKTYNLFFDKTAALEIKQDLLGFPEIILACNVLAHVPDPHDFIQGVSCLMQDNTVFVLEVPHALPMIKNTTFDVIFHQHYSYFSLLSLNYLLSQSELFINDIEQISTQGGGMRLFISTTQNDSGKIGELISIEIEEGLKQLFTYQRFSDRILSLKKGTIELLNAYKFGGKKIVGYGAPGKAANYLNYFGIGKNHLEYIVDISSSKHNKYFPNTQLEILTINQINIDRPDVILILAWNYATSIIHNLKLNLDYHPVFVVSLPNLEVFDDNQNIILST